MTRKVAFLALALSALFALQFGDCLSSMSAGRQTAQCCASMPCTPANHSHGCCKTMASSQSPNILPAAHASLRGPAVATFDYARKPDLARSACVRLVTVEAAQHSPPELYTLHASLLI